MRRFVVAVSMLFAVCAHAQSAPGEITAADRLATPLLVVPPKYLAHVMDGKPENFSVEVQMRGTVDKQGQFTSPIFLDPDGRERFIEALQRVLPLWRFRPALLPMGCSPIDSEMTLIVWFEMVNGKPSLSVSTPKVPAKADVSTSEAAPSTPKERVRRTWKTPPYASYPRRARAVGMEGRAELLMTANADGEIVASSVWYSIPNDEFGVEALDSIRGATLVPHAAELDKSKTVCVAIPFQFCLKDRVAIPSNGCNKTRQ